MPALITPFDVHEDLDIGAHRHNLDVVAAWGFEGVLVAGSTGEGPYLEPGERHALVAAARDHDWFVLCGIVGETARAARHRIAEAADAGADAALVLTPTTMVRGDDEAVVEHYRELAATSPIPLMAYSVPKWSGYRLPADTAADLAAAGLVGIKDSGGDVAETTRFASVDWTVYAGASAVVAASLAGGADGAITASANYVPQLVLRIVAGEDGQTALTAHSAAIERHGVAGVKEAARLAGLSTGRPRRPILPLTDEAAAEIAAAMDEV